MQSHLARCATRGMERATRGSPSQFYEDCAPNPLPDGCANSRGTGSCTALLLDSNRLLHGRVDAAEYLVDTRFIELELEGVILIERGGVKDSGVVDNRVGFAIEILPRHCRAGF